MWARSAGRGESVELAAGSVQRSGLDLMTIVTPVGHGPVSTDLLDVDAYCRHSRSAVAALCSYAKGR
jgi:hypothetical protein